MKNTFTWIKLIFASTSILLFTACTGTTSVSVGYGVYGGYGYSSYGYGGGYYGGGYYRPPAHRPDRPNKPDRPIHRPNRPTTLPGHARPSRPGGSMRSMGRPSGGMGMRRR